MPDRSTNENKAVEAYLQYLATGVVPPDQRLIDRLALLDQRIASEERLYVKVALIAEHRRVNQPTDASALVERFTTYAAGFSERNNIDYTTWREMGVPAKVLKAAGLKVPSHPQQARTGEADLRARKPRHRRTPEYATQVFQLYLSKPGDEGRRLVAEQFGYRDEKAVTSVLQDLSKRYPKVAAECGYDHSEHTMPIDQALAKAHAASMKKMAS